MKLFNWFNPKYSVCRECGTFFKPVGPELSRWADLCAYHRKPAMERDAKRDYVIAWATRNWERLAEQAEKDIKDIAEEWKKHALSEEHLAAMAKAQLGATQGTCGSRGYGLDAAAHMGGILGRYW